MQLMRARSRGKTVTSRVTRAVRLSRLIVHFVLGILIQALIFPWVDAARELRIIRWWSSRILAILNVRIHVKGSVPRGRKPVVIVANHVSWLDVWVILAVCPLRFVAKSDIRHWPLAGWLVAHAGTVFIERTRRHDTARINTLIGDVLRRGERIGLFPEGTTTDGSHLRPFHASLFQPALSVSATVVAAAIRYPKRDGSPNLDIAYTGNRSLLESLRLILRQPVLRVDLMFAGSTEASGKTRHDLARETRALIASALGFSVPGSAPETSADPPAVVP
ncbi:MAG TPA: lysophospholipid acyltransferase family protein [Burkholderiales bacterium]|nr:lysophospholipid acyltransferase family protein [Burkholderiales bacterium]